MFYGSFHELKNYQLAHFGHIHELKNYLICSLAKPQKLVGFSKMEVYFLVLANNFRVARSVLVLFWLDYVLLIQFLLEF